MPTLNQTKLGTVVNLTCHSNNVRSNYVYNPKNIQITCRALKLIPGFPWSPNPSCLLAETIWTILGIIRDWVFATNSYFLIPISFQPVYVNHWYFRLILFDLTEFICLKYLRYATLGCKDIGIRKSQFVVIICAICFPCFYFSKN